MSVFDFYAVTKLTTTRQQTKNQINFAKKCFRNHKAMLWPSKYVRQKKEKRQNSFRKKIISQDMKAINYEKKV